MCTKGSDACTRLFNLCACVCTCTCVLERAALAQLRELLSRALVRRCHCNEALSQCILPCVQRSLAARHAQHSPTVHSFPAKVAHRLRHLCHRQSLTLQKSLEKKQRKPMHNTRHTFVCLCACVFPSLFMCVCMYEMMMKRKKKRKTTKKRKNHYLMLRMTRRAAAVLLSRRAASSWAVMYLRERGSTSTKVSVVFWAREESRVATSRT